MDEKDITKAYWNIVGMEIKKVAQEDADMRGHLRIFKWICFLVALLFVLWLIKRVNITFFESAMANLVVEFLILGGPLFVSILSLIKDIANVPAKIYQKQGGFLENPFGVEVYKPERKPVERENRWVSLQVNNILPNKQVDQCHVRLDEVFDLKTKKHKLRDQQNLTWSGREHNQNQAGNMKLDISSGDFGVCDVAKAEPDKNNAHYTKWFGTEYIEPGEYVLSITVFGNWDGFSKSHPYHATLIFEGTHELWLKDVKEGKYEAEIKSPAN